MTPERLVEIRTGLRDAKPGTGGIDEFLAVAFTEALDDIERDMRSSCPCFHWPPNHSEADCPAWQLDRAYTAAGWESSPLDYPWEWTPPGKSDPD